MSTSFALVLDPTVQAALVSAFGLVIVALLGLVAEGIRRTHNGLRAVKKDTRGTREQVENSHATNLRDDLDGIRHLVEQVATTQGHVLEGQALLTTRVNQLRDDQTQSRADAVQERMERLAADQRIDQHIATVAVTAAEVARALQLREHKLDHNPGHDIT